MVDYTILAFDPGMYNLGYCFAHVLDSAFTVVRYGTIHPEEATKHLARDKYHNDRVINGRAISQTVQKLQEHLQPDYVTSEDAFYNPRRPLAYTSLLIVLYAIESILYKRYLHGDIDIEKSVLYKTPPALIKKIFYPKKTSRATKEDMTEALMMRVEDKTIRFACEVDQESLTEHAVDAIAVAYCFKEVWRPILEQKLLKPSELSFTKAVRKKLHAKKYLDF